MSPSKLFLSFVIVFVVLGVGPSPEVRAGFLTNGSFATNLTGWEVSDPEYAQVVGGQGLLFESPYTFEVTLSQAFTLHSDALVLSFRIVRFTPGTNPDNAFLPDAFGVSLLDSVTSAPLTATVLDEPDAYYTRDLIDGAAARKASTGVATVALPDGSQRIDLDVARLRGRDVRLRFRLLGGGDVYNDASITIDDVIETRSGSGAPPEMNPVPAPPGLYLCASAVPFLLFLRQGLRGRPVAAQTAA